MANPPQREEIERLLRRVEPMDRLHPGTFQATRASLIGMLNRPLRVCGVVPNTGEPGGGPFWARDADGTVRLQIIETILRHERTSKQAARKRALELMETRDGQPALTLLQQAVRNSTPQLQVKSRRIGGATVPLEFDP